MVKLFFSFLLTLVFVLLSQIETTQAAAGQCASLFKTEKYRTEFVDSIKVIVPPIAGLNSQISYFVIRSVLNPILKGLKSLFVSVRTKLKIPIPEVAQVHNNQLETGISADINLKVGRARINPVNNQVFITVNAQMDLAAPLDASKPERYHFLDYQAEMDNVDRLGLKPANGLISVKSNLINSLLNESVGPDRNNLVLKIGDYEYKIAGSLILEPLKDKKINPDQQKFIIKTKVLVDQKSTHQLSPTPVLYNRSSAIALDVELHAEFEITDQNEVSIKITRINSDNFSVDLTQQRNLGPLNKLIERNIVHQIVGFEIGRINNVIDANGLKLSQLIKLDEVLKIPFVKVQLSRIYLDIDGLVKIAFDLKVEADFLKNIKSFIKSAAKLLSTQKPEEPLNKDQEVVVPSN